MAAIWFNDDVFDNANNKMFTWHRLVLSWLIMCFFYMFGNAENITEKQVNLNIYSTAWCATRRFREWRYDG